MTRLHKDIHRLKAKLQSLNVVPPPKTSNQSFWSSTPSLNPPRPSNPVAGRNIDRINAKLQLLAARPQPKVSSGRISDSQVSSNSWRQSGPSRRKQYSYRWAGIAVLIALALFASVVIKPEIIGLVTFEETNQISLDRVYENNSLEILQFKGDPSSVRVSGALQGKSARVLLKSADEQHVLLEVNQEGYFESICQETCDLTQMHGEIVLAIEVQDANLTLSVLTYVTQSEDREPVWTAKKTKFILRPNTALSLNLSNYVKDPEGEALTFLVSHEGPLSAEIAGEMLTLQASQTTLEDSSLTVIASDSRQVLRIPLAIAVESGASIFDNTPALVDKKLAEQLDFIGEAKAIIKFSDAYLEALANRSGQDTEEIQRYVQARQRVFGEQSGVEGDNFSLFAGIAARVSKEQVLAAAQSEAVEEIVLDEAWEVSREDSVPLIGADQAQSIIVEGKNLSGSGLGLCVVDTGIDSAHQEFSGRIVEQYCYCEASDHGAGGCCASGTAEDASANDDNSHGTHVSGIAAGSQGVAPGTAIIAVKACDQSGSCTVSDVIRAIEHCIALSDALNISVITASIGDGQSHDETTCPTFLDTTLQSASSMGMTTFFASGNNGHQSGINYPACSPYVLAVAATTKQDTIAPYSNRGSSLDLLAPGSNIVSTVPGGYGEKSGTSMATPHASGAAMLLYEQARLRQTNMSPDLVHVMLNMTGKTIDGFPRIDLEAAIKTQINGFVIDEEQDILETSFGSIEFNVPVTVNHLPACALIDRHVISVDTQRCPEFNLSSRLVFKDVNLAPPYRVLMDGVPCPESVCANMSVAGTNVSVTVAHFTNFSLSSMGGGFETQGGPTSLTDCGLLDTASNNYTLTRDVNSTGTCFTVTQNDIYLDCAGFMINYSIGNTVSPGINATGRVNFTMNNCVITHGNHSVGSSHAIVFSATNNSKIQNARIILNNSNVSGSDDGILMNVNSTLNIIDTAVIFTIGGTGIEISQASNHTILNSNITTLSGPGLYLSSSGNNTIINNSLMTNQTNAGLTLSGSSNNAIESTDGMSIASTGIALSSNSNDNQLIGVNGTSLGSVGLSIASSTGNLITNSTAYSNISFALSISGSNNVILFTNASSTYSFGTVVGGHNNTFVNLSTYSQNTSSLRITSGQNNTFANTSIRTDSSWINTASLATGNNLTNTLFINGNGSIKLIGPLTLNISHIIGPLNLSITLNSSFINTSKFPFLNVSAQIALFNITQLNPRPEVDLEDDGSFADCDSPICVEQSFEDNVFVFNVSHFTTFQAAEGFTNCSTINSSTTLDNDVNASGTCFVISTKDVTLDCNGFSITYAISEEGNGVLVNGTTRNVSIVDCAINQFNDSLSLSHGISINRTNSSLISGNTINVSNSSIGIFATSIRDTQLIDNRVFADRNDSIRITALSINNTLVNNTAVSANASSIHLMSNPSLNRLFNNTGNSTSGAGISVDSAHNNTLINNIGESLSSVGLQVNASENNTIVNNTALSQNNAGLELRTSHFNKVYNNTAFASSGLGLHIAAGSSNNTFIANSAKSIKGIALALQNASNNTFINNSFSSNGTAIRVNRSSSANFLVNSSLFSNSTWIITDASNQDTNFSRTSFHAPNGTIILYDIDEIPSSRNISVRQLNTSHNRAFLNSSRFPFLNTTGQIVLHNIQFVDPSPGVDYDDDGNFDACNSPDCVEHSFIASTFVFNVSHFTTFRANQNVACQNFTQSASLEGNTEAIGDCFGFINVSNVTVDCNGFSILGNGLGSAVYIVNSTNITVKNCRIFNFETAVLINNSNTSTLLKNLINGSSRHGAIIIGRDNVLENNTFISNPVGVNISNGTNNTLFFNNFTASSIVAVITTKTGNNLNSTRILDSGRVAVGNSYQGTGTLDLKDFNIDGFAERGANYPYSSATGGNVSGPLQDFGPMVAPNSSATNSRVINSTKINSTIVDSFLINTTNEASRIENASETLSLLNRSGVFSGNITFSHIENSTLINVTATNTSTQNSTITNSSLSNASLFQSQATNSSISGSSARYSVMFSSTLISSILLNSTTNGSTLTNSTQYLNATYDSIVVGSTINDSLVISSTVDNSTINKSTVVASQVGNVSSINASVNGSLVSSSIQMLNETINSSITGSVLTDSLVINSTVDRSHIRGSRLSSSDLANATSLNATFDRTTAHNVTQELNQTINSSIANSTIRDAIIINSTIHASEVNFSQVYDSNLTAALLMNASVNRSSLHNTVQLLNQTVNSSVFNTSIELSLLVNSNVTSSTINRSLISSSNVTRSLPQDAIISSSILVNSSQNLNETANSTIINSTLYDSLVINSTADSYSFINRSIVLFSNSTGSRLTQTLLNRTIAVDSNVTSNSSVNSTLFNSTIHDSFVVNSTSDSASLINRSRIYSSNITGSLSQETVVNRTTLLNTNVTFNASINSSLVSSIIYDSLIVNSTSASGSLINQSNIYSSNVTGSLPLETTVDKTILVNTRVTFNTSINSSLINSTIYNSFVVNSTSASGSLINQSNIYSSNVTGSLPFNTTLNRTVMVNSTQDLNETINSSIINSTLRNSIVINTTLDNNATLINAVSLSSNHSGSFILNSTVREIRSINFTSINSTAINASITDSIHLDSRVHNTMEAGSNISNSFVFSANVTDSTLINISNVSFSILIGTNQTYNNTFNSTVIDASLISSIIINTTILRGDLVNSSVFSSNFTLVNMTNSTARFTLGSNSSLTNSSIDRSSIAYSNAHDSLILNSSIEGSNVIGSFLNNSNVTNSRVNTSMIFNSTLINVTVINSTVVRSIKINSIIIDSNISDSNNTNATLINATEIFCVTNNVTLVNSTCLNLTQTDNNNFPLLSRSIPDLTLLEGDDLTPYVNMSEFFSDPDGNNFTYSEEVDGFDLMRINGDLLSIVAPVDLIGRFPLRVLARDDVNQQVSSNTFFLTVVEVEGRRLRPTSGTRDSTVVAPPKSVATVASPSSGSIGLARTQIADTGISCGFVRHRKSLEDILSRPTRLPQGLSLAPGVDVAITPFNMTCGGDDMDLTLNVPDNFVDLDVLRCSEGSCSSLADYVAVLDNLQCGELNISEIRRLQQEAARELDFVPPEVLAKEGKLLTRADPTIEIGDYRFSAVLGKDESVWVRITTPNFTIHEPKNPSLKIVGIPLVVETNASRDHPLEGEITLPFAALEGFDNESLEVYSYERSDWRSLPGVHNKTTHTVTWHIPDLHARTDRSGIAVFGILGIACPNCVETEFKKIYDPGTRNAIVMVHGLLSSPLSWQLIIDDFSLNEQPWQMWTYGYRSSRTITELADDLKNSLELNSGQYDTLYLIGHSLGGLVIEEAVASAHNSSVAGERDFSFLKKVRKVITIGSPHEGSPAAAVYDNFFKNLVSQQGVTVAGGASRELLKELEKGRAAPEVPGIKYYVLAGTRPYEFNVGLFTVKAEDILTLVGKNDGITTVPSAQMVGGRQVNNSCEDYFEMNLTHTDLTDHPISRKVMARIITEDIKQQKERGVVGYNQYLRVEIPQCQMGETFVVVGKKIDPLAAKSVLGCGCGNGVCGVDESEESCPQDCAVVAMVSPLERFIYYASRAVVILFILFIVAYGIHRKRRRALPPSERRTPLRSLLKNLAHKAQGLVSQLSAAKSQGSWVPPQAPPPPTRPVLTLPSPRVPLSPSPTPQSHLVIPQVPFEWRSLLRPSQVPSLNVPPKIPSRAPQEKVPLMRAPLPPLQNPAPKPAPTLLPKPVPTQAQRLYPIVRKAAEVAQKGRAIASSISAQRPNIIKRFRIWWSCPRAQKPLPPRPIVQKALSQKPVPQKQTTSLRPLQRPLPQGPARGFVHLQNRIKEIKQASSRPSFHMPAISMPKFTLPSMPKIAWPTFKKRSLPSVDLFKARKAYLPARDTHKEDMEKLRKSIAELDAKLKKVRRLNR